ncbi:MAG: hypothetical protein ACRDTH_13510 [Pseudonocardiaceae bacterium]
MLVLLRSRYGPAIGVLAGPCLLGLKSAGLATCNSEGNAWRPDIATLSAWAATVVGSGY